MTESPLPDAFFHPAGTASANGHEYEVFDPTRWTASVWADTMQHGAPPAAIMVRAIESLVPDGTRVSRVTVDLL